MTLFNAFYQQYRTGSPMIPTIIVAIHSIEIAFEENPFTVLLLCKIFAKYSTHSGFWRLCVCVCVCVCVCLSVIVSVCDSNNFLLYSITKTILPGSSPHLVRTFLTSIPSFLLILGSFRKTRWPPCLFFYSIFSH